DMAQSVERILGKDEVPSSILGISTIKKKASLSGGFFVSAFLDSSFRRYLSDIQVETGLPRGLYLDGCDQALIVFIFPVTLYGVQSQLSDARTFQIVVKQACAADLGQSWLHPY
ncbi:hypothetical protein, partial [Aeromonas taiwanensis]|uniref:hypothetical protein n=1 Tax=Aeromonas taiwanensis TaxID=633417 RepID=UPI003EBECB8D